MPHMKTESGFRNVSLPFNPWLWMFAGLLISGLALVWTRFVHDEQSTNLLLQTGLVALGLVIAGSAVARRLTSKRESFLDSLPLPRRSLLLLLALVNAGLIINVVLLLLARRAHVDVPWQEGSLIFMLVLILPIAGWVALACVARLSAPPAYDKRVEGAAMLVLLAVCACLGGWALYLDQTQREIWDTMRVFLAGFALAALLGAPLVLMSMQMRKIVISLLIVVHFTGILTAVLSVPPVTPWVIMQLRQRIFRPYLQFMFLENAYQFYAPDPGPSNYWWFRIEYKDDDKNQIHSKWVKFPRMTEDTEVPDYLTGLQYYRRVAMSDQMALTDGTTPSAVVVNSKGQPMDNPVLDWRYRCAKLQPQRLLGQPMAHQPIPPEWEIPFHPSINPPTSQYRRPAAVAHDLIKSVIQHLAHTQPYHEDYPHAKMDTIKVYHVIHNWPTPQLINQDVRPTHPALYFPYYQGQYNTKAELLDEPKFDDFGNLTAGDPLLHWMIPIVIDEGTHPNESIIRGYVFKHAGDEKWRMFPGRDYWEE